MSTRPLGMPGPDAFTASGFHLMESIRNVHYTNVVQANLGWKDNAMWIVNLIIALISGAVGGNIAGSLLKNYDLGPLGNSIAGIVGGGLGGQVLAAVLGGSAAAGGGGLDIGSIVEQVLGGGVGGGILMIIIGIIRQLMGGQRHA